MSLWASVEQIKRFSDRVLGQTGSVTVDRLIAACHSIKQAIQGKDGWRSAVADQGGLKPLLDLVSFDQGGSAMLVREAALLVLGELALNGFNRMDMAGMQGMPLIIAAVVPVHGKEEPLAFRVSIQAATALWHLSMEETLRSPLARLGGIQSLCVLVHHCASNLQQIQLAMQRRQQQQEQYLRMLHVLGVAIGALSSLTLSDEACEIFMDLDEEQEDDEDESHRPDMKSMGTGGSIVMATMRILVSVLQLPSKLSGSPMQTPSPMCAAAAPPSSSTATATATATACSSALSACRVIGNLSGHEDVDCADQACELLLEAGVLQALLALVCVNSSSASGMTGLELRSAAAAALENWSLSPAAALALADQKTALPTLTHTLADFNCQYRCRQQQAAIKEADVVGKVMGHVLCAIWNTVAESSVAGGGTTDCYSTLVLLQVRMQDGNSSSASGNTSGTSMATTACASVSFVELLCGLMCHTHPSVQANAVGLMALLARGTTGMSSGVGAIYGSCAGSGSGSGSGADAGASAVSVAGVGADSAANSAKQVLIAKVSSTDGLHSLVVLAQAAQDEQVQKHAAEALQHFCKVPILKQYVDMFVHQQQARMINVGLQQQQQKQIGVAKRSRVA